MSDIQDILDFWFLPKSHKKYGAARPEWFQKNSEFDAEIKKRFLGLYKQAKAGKLLQWTETKEGTMALILIFDQFSRNMFRDTPDAFATDDKALALARHMLAAGHFNNLMIHEKAFAALPFEHSEKLADQNKSVELYKEMGSENYLDFAIKHYDIIKKFGRFPHRNKILRRKSTKAELEFLSQPGSSF